MAKIGRVVHQATGKVLLSHVVWCDSFVCKLRGLMFRTQLKPGEGLLMAEPYASRSATAIHMLFMRFPIATIWMDKKFRVVDVVYARPWALAYVPSTPARYTLEGPPELLDQVQIGDILVFEQQAGNDQR